MNNTHEFPDPFHIFGVWAEQNGYDLDDYEEMQSAVKSYALQGTQLELTLEEASE